VSDRAARSRRGASFFIRDPARLPDASDRHFDPEWWRESGRLTGAADGRGASVFLDAGETGWVLRHYRRGGVVAHLVEDRYIWAGLERTRAFAEWRLLAAMRDRGLPVPAPVAARVVRRGAAYRADLITARLPGVETLDERLTRTPLPDESWRRLGATLARFHLAGVYHHDLNARNIMVGQDDGFHLIDFDRGRMRRPGRWRKRNLQRLHRSLTKLAGLADAFHWTADDWSALIAGYEAAFGRR